ncbi:respiratory nitrate reductase 1 subunit beta [Escherichia coli]|uniref:Respiratory nitrate reductase 1 subunit beta n=1 Tax=Escherichia coli TaxID=562 RepID=A0A2X3JVX3_ECOLX|nr:respiratory nitrate reductase 1 subunit beta [Escherichia coli]
MAKIEKGPNWEDDLGGEFDKLAKDKNFDNIQKAMYSQFENTFMMYLPRLCEHCLNPACVATCPSGAIYKREEDGIVLIDQDKCRGWRMCITGCPYKKIYFNWKSGKSEKCIFCYPRIEAGQPTVCSETCVGRIRYLGVLLYDADAIERAASTENEKDLYQRQLDVFLDPNDPKVIEQAIKDGIPLSVIEAAQQSPVYKMAMEWKTGAAAASRISHTADGLVRAASVSDSVCSRRGRAGQQRNSARRRKLAYSGTVSGESADRR